MNTTPNRPAVLVFDEFHSFMAQGEDLLTTLRETPGVPDGDYFVKDGQVFVWARLHRLVRAAHPRGPVTADQVAVHLADAWVFPLQAVESEGVVPRPFEVKETANGWRIWHQGLSAWIPGTYFSWNEVAPALARLLVGLPIAGAGNATHGAQELVTHINYDMSSLPMYPGYAYPQVGGRVDPAKPALAYRTGYSAISQEVFDAIQVRAHAWETQLSRANALRDEHRVRAWEIAMPLLKAHLGALTGEALQEWQSEDALALQGYYPELEWLPAAVLYDLFDNYCSVRGLRFYAHQDSEFLAYLLGRIGEQSASGPTSGDTENIVLSGSLILADMLEGMAFESALARSHQAAVYNQALLQLTGALRKAMWFLEELGDKPSLPAMPKRTFAEGVAQFRSKPTRLFVAAQSLADFT